MTRYTKGTERAGRSYLTYTLTSLGCHTHLGYVKGKVNPPMGMSMGEDGRGVNALIGKKV